MALITCLECGKEVSDKAASCPHCGVPINTSGPHPSPPVSAPAQRVRTSEDSALTRNRGCADILIYGPILLFVLIILAGIFGR